MPAEKRALDSDTKRFPELGTRAQSGSKPRCHILTNGTRADVAQRLTSIIDPFGRVDSTDVWMPDGFANVEEAQLHRPSGLLNDAIRQKLLEWWLAPDQGSKRTPNFDIASTCTIGTESGLLLIEAKAHDYELIKESCGRTMERKNTARRALTARELQEQTLNHEQIGRAIEAARIGLSQSTSSEWKISRDTHYQMSNRFAWSWKLTEFGLPVILVYLGLLEADEMKSNQKTPLADEGSWETLVRAHSDGIVPKGVWNTTWSCNGRSLSALIRSVNVPLDSQGAENK